MTTKKPPNSTATIPSIFKQDCFYSRNHSDDQVPLWSYLDCCLGLFAASTRPSVTVLKTDRAKQSTRPRSDISASNTSNRESFISLQHDTGIYGFKVQQHKPRTSANGTLIALHRGYPKLCLSRPKYCCRLRLHKTKATRSVPTVAKRDRLAIPQ